IDLQLRPGRVPGILQRVLVLGFCALLIFAVLAFGAVDEWSTFAFEAGTAVLFLVWAGEKLVSKKIELSKDPLYLPAFLVFGLSMGHVLRGGNRALVGFCAVLMASTIFLSGSRGGMLAFVFEIVLFAALILGKRQSPRIALGSMAVCVLILALLVFLGKGQVLGRLGDLSPGIRLDITKDSLRMFFKRPVAGWGLGTFPTVYPSYRSFYTNLFVNEAHNDYAQLLVETGLVGFGLMLWFLARLYRHGLPTSRRWEFRWDGAVSLASLLGCTGILLHSIVDFNLQIPANAAMFYALCGLAPSMPLSESSIPPRSPAITKAGIGGRTPSDTGGWLARST